MITNNIEEQRGIDGVRWMCVQLRSQLQVQLGSLQVDYEAAVLRAEEESEASTQLRAQVSRLNSELSALKGKYDRELLQKSEEFEEYKCALNLNH